MAGSPPDRIAGPRVVLRPPVLNDAGALFQRVARDPDVTRYLMWAPHPNVAATRRVISEKLNVDAHDRTWAVTLRNSGEIIGLMSCRRAHAYSAEVGYCIGRRWWGKGLMSEALDIMVAALADDPRVYRVWATCNVDNERSARLLERAGFTLEGRLGRNAVYPNLGPEPRDSLLYAIVLR